MKENNEQDYKAINCSFYDKLLDLASLKENVVMAFEVNNQKKTENGLIKAVFTKDKAEYLLLDSGTVIRLDYIFSVNGFELPNSSCSIK